MISIHSVTPNEAYWRLLRLATENVLRKSSSRIGNCIELGHVFIELDEGERLCLLRGRGINPIFALVEAAWILAGSNSLAPLQSLIANYAQYSDDGVTLNGAYGFRLRKYFGLDQIEKAIHQLSITPDSRRVVLSMYSAEDLGNDSRDIPCNTEVILRIEDSRLAMTVFNRSNDLWLGVPYNWFTFRCLQTFIAKRLAVQPGVQRHISACMHLYEKDIVAARRVVAMNSLSSIRNFESLNESLDISDLLLDINALSTADFDNVRSPALKNILDRYKITRKIRATELSSEDHFKNSLETALNIWAIERNFIKEKTVPTNELDTNPDYSTHLALQQWILSDTGREFQLTGLRTAAANVKPYLNLLLNQDMPEGVKAILEDPASEKVSLQIVLELILGSIDPFLARAPLGIQFRQRLQNLAIELGLSNQHLRGRELPESDLKIVFRNILR